MRQFGDTSYADAIADANGLVTLTAGMVLRMPMLIPSRYNAGTVDRYEAFVNALMSQFTIYLSTPQPPPPKRSSGFFQNMIRVVVQIVSVAIGIVFAPVSVGTSIAMSALIAGAIAAATNAALQLALIAVNIENKFLLVSSLDLVGIEAFLEK